MKALTHEKLFIEHVRAVKKWGLNIVILTKGFEKEKDPTVANDEILKAIPFLRIKDNFHLGIITNRSGYFLFDSREEIDKAILRCQGIDPETGKRFYEGPIVVIGQAYTPEADFYKGL
jgi:hypothetical protein